MDIGGAMMPWIAVARETSFTESSIDVCNAQEIVREWLIIVPYIVRVLCLFITDTEPCFQSSSLHIILNYIS